MGYCLHHNVAAIATTQRSCNLFRYTMSVVIRNKILSFLIGINTLAVTISKNIFQLHHFFFQHNAIRKTFVGKYFNRFFSKEKNIFSLLEFISGVELTLSVHWFWWWLVTYLVPLHRPMANHYRPMRMHQVNQELFRFIGSTQTKGPKSTFLLNAVPMQMSSLPFRLGQWK